MSLTSPELDGLNQVVRAAEQRLIDAQLRHIKHTLVTANDLPEPLQVEQAERMRTTLDGIVKTESSTDDQKDRAKKMLAEIPIFIRVESFPIEWLDGTVEEQDKAHEIFARNYDKLRPYMCWVSGGVAS